MEHDILTSLTRLPDTELVAQVKTLIARERGATAAVIAHLAELDTRDIHLREGYASLFAYCRDALGLSEWEAYNRIDVARAARRFPVILEMLAEGSVHLTAVRLLAPHLTPGNHREVLDSARGRKKTEVEEIVARLSPRPDARPFVRRISTCPSESGAAHATQQGLLDATPAVPSSAAASPARPDPAMAVPSRPAAGAVEPLSTDRYKLQVTISGDTLERLRLAQDMLGHSIPSGDDAAILDRALTALLVDLAKKKFADTSKPRHSSGRKPGSRTPSAAVKRAVWVRDLGRCAFVGTSGHRCGARRFVEFHHVDPYALGGEATVDGIQLRCRRHNDYEGRLYFGKRRRELVLEQVQLTAERSM
jgi:hypothetical protein